jgi:hypothetical protein
VAYPEMFIFWSRYNKHQRQRQKNASMKMGVILQCGTLGEHETARRMAKVLTLEEEA